MSTPPEPDQARIEYLRALSSPARIEVVEGLQIGGPSSVAELGRRLGRAPDSLYYHLRELEKAGVVERSGAAAPKGRGRRGVVYRVLPGPVGAETPKGESDSQPQREAMGEMASAIMRLTDRDVNVALTGAVEARPGPGFEELPVVQRTKAWMSPEDAVKLGAMLDQVDDFLRARAEPDSKGRSLCALTYVLTTLVPHTSNQS